MLETEWAAAAEEFGLGSKFRVVNSSIDMLRGDGHKGFVRNLEDVVWDDCLHNCFPVSTVRQ